jgi:hypothetical protein
MRDAASWDRLPACQAKELDASSRQAGSLSHGKSHILEASPTQMARRLMMTTLRSLSFLGAAFAATVAWCEDPADTSDLSSQLQAAKKRLAASEQVQLQYKFKAGESVRWEVVHLGTTETTISGNTQTSKSRAKSVKVWTIGKVDDEGNMTFTHSVESVNMWQQLTDRPEIRYDSTRDDTAPAEYQAVADTVGKPLTTVTIQPDGSVVDRDSASHSSKFGVGNIVMLLPPKPVKLGSQWSEPSEIRARIGAREKRIKIRKLYTLSKIATGVATITVKTQVLTPVTDPQIESQLMQQLTNGTIKFDIDEGRILSKELNWDKSVVGFSGADSMMKYLARFTEQLLPQETNVARSQDTVTR